MPLKDIQCKNAKPRAKAYKIGDSLGLYLHVMSDGAKYWRLRYRFLKKQKLLALGVYPQVPLLEARGKRDQARKLLATGVDPSAFKQEQKRVAATPPTPQHFAALDEQGQNDVRLFRAISR